MIVEPTWLFTSSPMIGTPAFSKRVAQTGSLAMKTGMAFTKATPASIAAAA